MLLEKDLFDSVSDAESRDIKFSTSYHLNPILEISIKNFDCVCVGGLTTKVTSCNLDPDCVNNTLCTNRPRRVRIQ